MVRTCRRRMSLRLPGLPQVGHGAWLGAYFTGMVRTWGRLISMACVLRGTWLANHISQHAGFKLLCQRQLWNTKTLSAAARSVDNDGPKSACQSANFQMNQWVRTISATRTAEAFVARLKARPLNL